ncbi:MAG TPA: hypothetical protein VFE53_07330 [Mucilaginibacter sp.]|nr:hypothetical protein [Mucilaginibacter sp.]
MFKAIRKKYQADRNKNQYLEEVAMYCAVTPWLSLAFFGLVEANQLIEVLCTNTGIVILSILFILRSIRKFNSSLIQHALEYNQPADSNAIQGNKEIVPTTLPEILNYMSNRHYLHNFLTQAPFPNYRKLFPGNSLKKQDTGFSCFAIK